MNILLDTQIALWALTDSPRLPDRARALIQDVDNTIYFSAASVWEISIKHQLARGDMPVSGEEAAKLFRDAGYLELPITAHHAATTAKLPLRHADPFDRMLVAQALDEPLRLLTHDRKLQTYDESIIFV
jgi:PIN domain nuclease of toxin-antitoxin system